MPNQLIVSLPGGSDFPLFQKEPLRSVSRAEQITTLVNSDVFELTVESAEMFEIPVKSTVRVFGKKYTMNQRPTARKLGQREFETDLVFEGPQYLLRDAPFFNMDESGWGPSPEFSLTGDLDFFLGVLINNLVSHFGAGTWHKGIYPGAAVQTLSFSQQNCLSAMQQICAAFKTEFEMVEGSGYTLNFKKVGQVLGDVYGFGRGYGLYELRRLSVVTRDIITRVYPFGSTQNLPRGYRGYSTHLTIGPPGYIENTAATAAFGLKAGIRVYEDIKPERTGVVTTASGVLTFVDATMDFDLFEKSGADSLYLPDGGTAKVHFNTGDLAGMAFEVFDYKHATKTFTLKAFDDGRNTFPSPTDLAFRFAAGDEYALLNIIPPDTYVEVAENRLRIRAEEEVAEPAPDVRYELTFDEMFLAEKAGMGSIVNVFEVGDYVHVADPDLLIDGSTRIQEMRRNWLQPYDYKLVLDDVTQVSYTTVINEIRAELSKIIKLNDLRDPNRARMGYLTTLELLNMIFDTDGYFDGGKIKPESIETLMLVVGAKSQQFILQDVIIEPNFEGDPNVIVVSEGLLIHYALKEEIVTWNIQASTTTLTSSAARYMYAKVSKTSYTDGNIIFSTEQIKPDDDPNYYHFLVGTLSSVMEGVRWPLFTYGQTAINGRFIKTGRLQSFDGRTFFDLDMSLIGGNIRFIDSYGNYRDLSDIGADTDKFFELVVTEPLDSYPAGFITAWFASSNPAIWPSGEEIYHEGDHWFFTATSTVYKRVAGMWEVQTDAKVLQSFLQQYARVGPESKIGLYTAQPEPPYQDGDLWMSPQGLRRSVKNKLTGATFDVNDWVIPFNFDNTTTAIDGHIITSGILQLSGDKYAIWAGVSGQGTEDTDVRFWAGASTENRETAPFRVLQNGWLIARTKIAVEGYDAILDGYKEQAGMAGWDHTLGPDDFIRFWAGQTYENRDIAPWQVKADGSMKATKGEIGNWTILGNLIVNDEGTAAIIARKGNVAGGKATEALIGPGIISGMYGGAYNIAAWLKAEEEVTAEHNVALMLEASGATVDTFGQGGGNISLYAKSGTAVIAEMLRAGDKTLDQFLPAGYTEPVDPRGFDFIMLRYTTGAVPGITFIYTDITKDHLPPMYNGKEVTVLSLQDDRDFRLINIVKGNNNYNVEGGKMITLKYADGDWFIKCQNDNNW